MEEKLKLWHFDPATERAAALANNPNAEYLLLPATPKDTQQAVDFYQFCPMPKYEVAKVEVIYNRNFNVKFNIYLHEQQLKKDNPVYVPHWDLMSGPGFRRETHAALEKISYVDPDHPDVKIIPGWHGTRPEALDSIFKTGYSNLAFTDSGFFGKGLYSAYEAEYSYRVYSKGALILNWVACFSAFPVIDGDMPLLTGKANYGTYDAHFVPVFPQNPDNPNEVNYFPCKPGEKAKYHEIVAFQTAACLPRFLVTLQPTLPKEIDELPVKAAHVVQIVLPLPVSKTEKELPKENPLAKFRSPISQSGDTRNFHRIHPDNKNPTNSSRTDTQAEISEPDSQQKCFIM